MGYNKIKYIDSAKMRVLPDEQYQQLWAQAYNLFLQDNEGYRLDSNDLAFIERENRNTSEYLPGELELYDFLDWDADISQQRIMNAS